MRKIDWTKPQRCNHCRKTKEPSEFYLLLKTSDRRNRRCIDCMRKWNRKNRHWYANYSKHKRDECRRLHLCLECRTPLSGTATQCIKHLIANAASNTFKSRSHAAELLKMYTRSPRCPYTGDSITPGINAELDHILPQSRFRHLITDINNVEWVSTAVNRAKRDLTKDEFIELCRSVVRHCGS